MAEKLRKVAIVTLYDDINIGNKLQNYAMQEILKNYFDSVSTLSYSEAKQMAPDMGWRGKIIAKIGFPAKIAREKRAILKRRKKFEKFSSKYLDVTLPKSFSEYNDEFVQQFDKIIVGSDQVWHNWSMSDIELRYFFLEFVPREKRICIAPSFGLDEIPIEFIEKYKKGLDGFIYLSCREKKGCQIINDLCQRKAILLPDPTMCVKREIWDNISVKPVYDIPDKFILAYFIGKISDKTKREIDKMSKYLKMKVINIYDICQPDYYVTSPEEFIYLISHAQYVVTNSFHASVFSIMYHVNFHCFSRDDAIGVGMSDRIETLLTTFDIDNGQLIHNYKRVDIIQEEQIAIMKNYIDLVLS